MSPAVWVAALALALPPAVAAEQWSYRAEAFGGYDSNVGNSSTPHDRRGSTFVQGATSATRETRYGPRTALRLTESIALERWLHVDQLTNMRYAARVRLLHRLGRSFYAPILAAWADVGVRHSASEIRSGHDYSGGLSMAMPVTTAVMTHLRVWRTWRKASGRVFELDTTSYSLDVDWRIGGLWTAYGGVRVDDGDFTVTGRGFGIVGPKDQHLYLEPRASAIEADPAFGPDWWAFRVDGATVIGALGANLRLSPALALDVQLQRGEVRMGGFAYERRVGSVGVLFRW